MKEEGLQTGENEQPPEAAVGSEQEESSMWNRFVGFGPKDFKSTEAFMKLCSRPCDPSNLAAFRIAFGILMVFDGFHERGLGIALSKWSDDFEVCRFPVFDFLKPLPVEYMCVLYAMMSLGSIGIALGAFFRLSCFMFAAPYWYMFLMEKSNWNNHSYLFGLLSTAFMFTDANRVWSVDAWRNKKIKYTHIPVWQYGLFRFQIFIVYFIAGLKKMDRDWVEGYSMSHLGRNWIFDPFRYILSDENIDFLIVHLGGLIIDLTGGWLLYFNETRWFGTFMVSSFHVMNSRIFAIGQFPYAMLCTTALFYEFDWPKKIFFHRYLPTTDPTPSTHCLYKDKTPSWYHRFTAIGVVLWISWQGFMPYSHCVTQGYNTWVGGLYGYSWDMMIHQWQTQHIKIKYVSKRTGEEGFLEPTAFVKGNRWASHPDMIQQHARCIAGFLQDYGVYDVEIYMDIWQSLNHRFQQRTIKPDVDLITAPWNTFKQTNWMLPLLNDLTSWRSKLEVIGERAKAGDIKQFIERSDVTFIADFPGMALENFIDPDLGRTNITLLAGEAMFYNPKTETNTTLKFNKPIRIPSGTHKVYTISDEPGCFMYTYTNTTRAGLEAELNLLEHKIRTKQLKPEDLDAESNKNETIRRLVDMKKDRDDRMDEAMAERNRTMYEDIQHRIKSTYSMVRSGFRMATSALESLVTGKPMLDVVEKRYGEGQSYLLD